MRFIIFNLLLFLAIGSFPGCGSLEQTIHIQPDLSGRMSYTFVPSPLVINQFRKKFPSAEYVNEYLDFARDSELDTIRDLGLINAMMVMLSDSTNTIRYDTSIQGIKLFDKAFLANNTFPVDPGKVMIHFEMDSAGLNRRVGLEIDFNSLIEMHSVTEFFKNKFYEERLAGKAKDLEIQPVQTLKIEFDRDSRILKAEGYDLFSCTIHTMNQVDPEETGALLEEFMSSMTIQTRYILPWEVNSCSIEKAFLTKDNRVIINQRVRGLVEGKESNSYTIVLEKK